MMHQCVCCSQDNPRFALPGHFGRRISEQFFMKFDARGPAGQHGHMLQCTRMKIRSNIVLNSPLHYVCRCIDGRGPSRCSELQMKKLRSLILHYYSWYLSGAQPWPWVPAIPCTFIDGSNADKFDIACAEAVYRLYLISQ